MQLSPFSFMYFRGGVAGAVGGVGAKSMTNKFSSNNIQKFQQSLEKQVINSCTNRLLPWN
jgi:hypothetical protein